MAVSGTGAMIAPPLSIYVHMPWCVRKCPYCDFNSHAAPAQLPQARYVDCLLEDLDHDLQWAQGRTVESIFFGGGTPSLFAPDEIGRVLAALRARMPVAADAEVTLEANPGAVERSDFADYRAAGVNRVSLGVQSFDDLQLGRLGRIHDSAQVQLAVGELHAAGIDNFNLDLMYGLPEQTVEAARLDIQKAIALRPTHISHYQLTLEPGTVFYHRPPPLPDDESAWAMQEVAQALLADSGYQQYEVSAYAQAGRQCRHNLNYWRFGDYLGLGAGAHGKFTNMQSRQVWRTARQKQPAEYMRSAAHARLIEHKLVANHDLPFEFMLNVLRLGEGFSPEEFRERTGCELGEIASTLAEAVRLDLLKCESSARWAPTSRGARYLNDLVALFLPRYVS